MTRRNALTAAAANAVDTGSTSPRVARIFTVAWGIFVLNVICCLLWGSAFPCIKFGYQLFSISAADTGSKLLFAGVRFFLAGFMVTVFMSLRRGRLIRPRVDEFPVVVLLSLFQTILQYIFFYVGLSHALGTTSSIINSSSTFLSILMSALLFRQERITGRKILGCVLGFTGVILVNLGKLAGGMGSFALDGEGFIFLSALSGAVVSCLLRLFTQKHDAVMLSGWQFMFGGLVLCGIGLGLGGQLHLMDPSGIALILYMAFISACAYSLSSIMLSVNPVSRIAVYRFMTPIFGFVLSAIILGEGAAMDPLMPLLALALVAAGIIVVNESGRPTDK